MNRPSDYFLSFYQPINDKMAYKEMVGIKPETPFIGVAYQLVKLLEDFSLSFAHVFKRPKATDQLLSQGRIFSAIKMVALSALYLITHVFFPILKLMSNSAFRAAFVSQYFKGEKPLKTSAIHLVYWISNTLDIALNLLRGLALIAFAIPVILSSPIRFFFSPANEQQALEGRKVSRAFTDLKKVLLQQDASETEKLMKLVHFIHFFKRRIDSGHISMPAGLKECLLKVSQLITNGKDIFSTLDLDFDTSSSIKINPVKSQTLGGEKQLSLNLAASLGQLSTDFIAPKSSDDLKALIKTQIDTVFP